MGWEYFTCPTSFIRIMSFFNVARTASRVEGHSTPRRSSGSSSYGCNPRRRNYNDLLAEFDLSSSPTICELYELQVILDNHCLKLAINEDLRPTRYATSTVNSVVPIAVHLSSPLCVARFPGTFLYQEVQLRTLISCLALLHYHEVEALNEQQWDRIHKNITELYRTVSFQTGAGMTPTEGIRYAPNVYLVQLVSVYFSFVQRGDSALPSVVGPICKIFFGSLGVVGCFCSTMGCKGSALTLSPGKQSIQSCARDPRGPHRAIVFVANSSEQI